MNFWLMCRAEQDVAMCFCTGADTETGSGEGEEHGEHSREDQGHCLRAKACSYF